MGEFCPLRFSKNWSISSKLSNLSVYSHSWYPFVIPFLSVVMHFVSFLIMVISFFFKLIYFFPMFFIMVISVFFYSLLGKSLSILLIFSKTQLFVSLIFYIVFLFSISLIFALISIIFFLFKELFDVDHF